MRGIRPHAGGPYVANAMIEALVLLCQDALSDPHRTIHHRAERMRIAANVGCTHMQEPVRVIERL